MKHAGCGGELQRLRGKGHYQCRACGERVETGLKAPSPALNGRGPSRWSLSMYDQSGDNR